MIGSVAEGAVVEAGVCDELANEARAVWSSGQDCSDFVPDFVVREEFPVGIDVVLGGRDASLFVHLQQFYPHGREEAWNVRGFVECDVREVFLNGFVDSD